MADDGYTHPFYIRAIPGLHGDTRGKVRRALHNERYIIQQAAQAASPSESSKVVISAICMHIKECDAKNREGAAYDAKYDSTRLMDNVLLERMYRIAIGIDPGDEDPKRPWGNDEVRSEFEALMENKDPAVAREEAEAGNSQAG